MSLTLSGSGNTNGRVTVAFGTVINSLVPSRKGAFTRISTLKATAAGTAHVATALRSLGRTTFTGAGAASQAVVNLTANPGPSGNLLAANDWVAIRETDGITRLYQVSSISTLAVTLTANLTTGVAATGVGVDSALWMFGVAADTDPRTGAAHPGFTVPASATTTYTDNFGGVVASIAADEPILVQSNNATATGIIEQVSYAYSAV